MVFKPPCCCFAGLLKLMVAAVAAKRFAAYFPSAACQLCRPRYIILWNIVAENTSRDRLVFGYHY